MRIKGASPIVLVVIGAALVAVVLAFWQDYRSKYYSHHPVELARQECAKVRNRKVADLTTNDLSKLKACEAGGL